MDETALEGGKGHDGLMHLSLPRQPQCRWKLVLSLVALSILLAEHRAIAHPPLLTQQQNGGQYFAGRSLGDPDNTAFLSITGNTSAAAAPPGNVIQNATQRAARVPGVNTHGVLEPGGQSAFPGLQGQELPIVLNSSIIANGHRDGFFFGMLPPPPPPANDNVKLTLGLPQLPPLFGGNPGGGQNPAGPRVLPGGLGVRPGDGAPDPRQGPVTVIPGVVEITSPTDQNGGAQTAAAPAHAVSTAAQWTPSPTLPLKSATSPSPNTPQPAPQQPLPGPQVSWLGSPSPDTPSSLPPHPLRVDVPAPAPNWSSGARQQQTIEAAIAPAGQAASFVTTVRLAGKGLWPYDAAKQRAVVETVAQLLKVPASAVRVTSVSEARERRRRLLDLQPGVDVQVEVMAGQPNDLDLLKDRLSTAAASGELVAGLHKAGVEATSVTLVAEATGPARPLCNGYPCEGAVSARKLPRVAIAAGAGAAGLMVLVVCVWCCTKAIGRRRRRAEGHPISQLVASPRAAQSPTGVGQNLYRVEPYKESNTPPGKQPLRIELHATSAPCLLHNSAPPPVVTCAGDSSPAGSSPTRDRGSRRGSRSPSRSPSRARRNSPSPSRMSSSFTAADAIVLDAKASSMFSLSSSFASLAETREPAEASVSTLFAEEGLPVVPEQSRRTPRTSARIQNTINLLRNFAGELSVSGTESPQPGAAARSAEAFAANEPLFLSPTGNLDAPNRINAANNQLAAFSSSLSPSNAGKTIQQLLLRLNANRTKLASKGATGSQVTQLHSAMEFLTAASKFAGKYEVEGAVFDGASCILAKGRQQSSGARVQLKFFVDQRAFNHEKSFYSFARRQGFMPGLLDVIDAGEAPLAAGVANPSCVVTQRGDYTLSDWLHRERNPSQLAQKGMLCNLLEAVAYLHTRNLVHRDVRPANISWFEGSARWRLAVPSAWAKRAADAPITYNLRYAAPEVVTADAMGVATRLKQSNGKKLENIGDTYYVVDTSTDMWAVGVVAWELFTGRPLFGENFADEQVAAMALGFRPLPFESDPSLWVLFRDAKAAQLVQGLLMRQPDKRLTAAQALQEAGVLSSASGTLSPSATRSNSASGRRLLTK